MATDFKQSPLQDRRQSPHMDFLGTRITTDWAHQIITGGRRINGFRIYRSAIDPYTPGEYVPSLALQREQRDMYARQTVVYNGWALNSGWTEQSPVTYTGIDNFDDAMASMLSVGYPERIKSLQQLYIETGEQWPAIGHPYGTCLKANPYRDTAHAWPAPSSFTGYHEQAGALTLRVSGVHEANPKDGVLPPWTLVGTLDDLIDFRALLGELTEYANGINIEAISIWLGDPTLGVLYQGFRGVERDEYRGTIRNPLLTDTDGFTGAMSVAGDALVPYADIYTAGVGIEDQEIIDLIISRNPMSDEPMAMPLIAGWSSPYDPFERTKDEPVATPFIGEPRWIVVTRRRFWPVNPALVLPYWVGRCVVYYDWAKEEGTDLPAGKKRMWRNVRWMRAGYVSSTMPVTLDVPTGGGCNDFAEVGEKYLGYACLEFAIVGETPAEWSARTGLKVLYPITTGDDEVTTGDGDYTADHEPW